MYSEYGILPYSSWRGYYGLMVRQSLDTKSPMVLIGQTYYQETGGGPIQSIWRSDYAERVYYGTQRAYPSLQEGTQITAGGSWFRLTRHRNLYRTYWKQNENDDWTLIDFSDYEGHQMLFGDSVEVGTVMGPREARTLNFSFELQEIPEEYNRYHLESQIKGQAWNQRFGGRISVSAEDNPTVVVVDQTKSVVYRVVQNEWTARGSFNHLYTGDDAYKNRSGLSISADGNTISHCSIEGYNSEGEHFGYCRIMNFVGSDWQESKRWENRDTNKRNHGIDTSLSNDGTIVSIGWSGAKKCSVYSLVNNDWVLRDEVGSSTVNNFGVTCKINGSDGNTLIVAGDNKLFVYKWDESFSIYTIDSIPSSTGQYNGWASAISNDGMSFIITGETYAQAFTSNGSMYVPKGQRLSGNDWFGWSVSMSDDGDTIAVSSTGENQWNIEGYVTVFKWNETSNQWDYRSKVANPDGPFGSNEATNWKRTFFGAGVAFHKTGDILYTGRPGDKFDKGAVFRLSWLEEEVLPSNAP